MKDDVEKLEGKVKKLQTNARHNKSQIKRLQLLANYVLAAMSEKDFDSDPMIKKSFDKCDRAGDLDNA